MKNRHEFLSISLLLPLLLFFSPGVYTQLAKDPQRDLSVSFSSKHEGTDPGSVFGVVTNKSANAYPCVRIEFDLYMPLRPLGPKSHLGVLRVEVRNVHPRAVRDYQRGLPFPATIGLKSVSECPEQPTEELPDILSFTVTPPRIQAGQTATLQWRTANTDHVFIGERNPEWPRTSSAEPIRAPRGIAPSGSLQVSPSQTTTYTLGAAKWADSVFKSVTVEVTSSVHGDGTDQHWRLSSKSKVSNEPVSNRAPYRLITAGGQLAWNNKVFEGLHIIPVARGYENMLLEPKRPGGVSLNEPVALYCDNRAAYIIHKKGPAFSLGFASWDPTREPPMARPAGIYQWVFRSPPGASIRDHQTRDIVTLETLGLFNTSVGAYLVYDSKARTLRWLKP